MNKTLRLIIADNQKYLRPTYDIVPRDLDIQPIPRKVTTIIGLRRCGKSTWCSEKINSLLDEGVASEHICHIDFSDDRLIDLRSIDSKPAVIGDAFYELHPHLHNKMVYFFFDEIQYVNNWALFINRLQTTKPCEVYITGSSAKLLAHELASEMGARSFVWELFPFSFHEFLKAKGLPGAIVDSESRDYVSQGFREYLVKGGMPEVLHIQRESMRIQYLQNLVNDVLSRDLILRYEIPHPQELRQLMVMMINSYSRLITVNKLKNRLDSERYPLSPKLITEYIALFEDCFLLFTVPIRSYNRRVQAVNPKKVYCVDHVLAASFGVSPSADRGLMLENIVFIHLRKQTHQIFYYKTQRGGEIDFAVGHDDAIVLIQVCWSLREHEGTRNREVKTLFDAMDELNRGEGWIITSEDEETIVEAGRIIHVVPAHQWLLR